MRAIPGPVSHKKGPPGPAFPVEPFYQVPVFIPQGRQLRPYVGQDLPFLIPQKIVMMEYVEAVASYRLHIARDNQIMGIKKTLKASVQKGDKGVVRRCPPIKGKSPFRFEIAPDIAGGFAICAQTDYTVDNNCFSHIFQNLSHHPVDPALRMQIVITLFE
jgi:hypothetical protein